VSNVTVKLMIATKKIIIEFPEKLLEQMQLLADELSIDRSKLIRLAVEAYLERVQRTRLEEELAEGYRIYAEFDRQICAR
jgi:metal-responsive CopG/Arc/MetJ family transcriptional regulator